MLEELERELVKKDDELKQMKKELEEAKKEAEDANGRLVSSLCELIMTFLFFLPAQDELQAENADMENALRDREGELGRMYQELSNLQQALDQREAPKATPTLFSCAAQTTEPYPNVSPPTHSPIKWPHPPILYIVFFQRLLVQKLSLRLLVMP